MATAPDVAIRDVLFKRVIGLGLYDEERANELISRIEHNDQAMLALIGRLTVEAERGGSGVQQGIRALVNTEGIPEALNTYDRLVRHELDDESFPRTLPQ